MTDKLQEITQEIAKRHGVLVGRDDPILMLHTMNEMLMQENLLAKQTMLGDFKSEMEQIRQGWEESAHKKAESILNAALHKSKETIERVALEMVERCFRETQQEIYKLPQCSKRSACRLKYRYGGVAIGACFFGVFFAILFNLLLCTGQKIISTPRSVPRCSRRPSPDQLNSRYSALH